MVKGEAKRPANMLNPRRRHWQTVRREMRRYRSIYLLLIPGIIFFAVFAYSPLYGLQLVR